MLDVLTKTDTMAKMIITWEDALTAWREQGVQAVPSRMLEVLMKEAWDRLEVINSDRIKRELTTEIEDALTELKRRKLPFACFNNNVDRLLMWHEDNKPTDITENELPDPADMADHANDVAGDR